MSLENIEKSLRMMYEKARRSHNAIHQLMLAAPNLYPEPLPGEKTFEWHRHSAFLTCHWEIFHLAHTSYQQALCGNYNAAFTLLRTSLELVIRGAFFDCLAYKRFRDSSGVIDREPHSIQVKRKLLEIIRLRPAVEYNLEKVSISIYDNLEQVIDDPKFRVPVKTMIGQLSEWGLFQGIKNTKETVTSFYSELSKDVHVLPDRTDIGKVVIHSPRDLFKTPRPMRRILSEYLDSLKDTMDIGIVLTINVLQDNIEQHDEARDYLEQLLRNRDFRSLLLKHSPTAIQLTLGKHSPRC
jgi:hypothetical protein